MSYYPFNASFRAGFVTGAQWNENNVGDYSVAFGYDNTASGDYSFASGLKNTVLGVHSVSFGESNTLDGSNGITVGNALTISSTAEASAAFGESNSLSEDFSIIAGQNNTSFAAHSFVVGESNSVNGTGFWGIATGKDNITKGYYAYAGGLGNTAKSLASFVIGKYSLEGANGNASLWVSTDPIFAIGNGGGIGSESDAFVVYKNGTATLNGVAVTSDARLKTNVHPLDNALDNILRIEGVSYNWDKKHPRAANMTDRLQFGIIAQELEKVYPQLIITKADGYKTINYIGLVPVLVEAMQEQQQQITDLQKENEQLRQSNVTSEAKLNTLEEKYNSMNQRIEQLESLLNTSSTENK